MARQKHVRQIRMCWLRGTERPQKYDFPEGYTVEHYNGDYDQKVQFYRLWCGKYGTDQEVRDMFGGAFEKYRDCVPEKDVFFVRYNGEIVASITAIYHKREKCGYVHMVCIREDFRGKHLSRPLNSLAMQRIWDDGGSYAFLTTNDWRENAIRSYIKAGFLPQMNAYMPKERQSIWQRWEAIYEKLELGEIQMLSMRRKPLSKPKNKRK